MFKKLIIVLIFSVLAGRVSAEYAVHDIVAYIQDTMKAAQDEVYQSLNIDAQVEQLQVMYEDYRNAVEQLQTLYKQLEELKNIYDGVVKTYEYIGDPEKLTAYLNSEFIHDENISQTLSVVRKYKNTEITDPEEVVDSLNYLDYTISKTMKHKDSVKENEKAFMTSQEITNFYLEGQGSIEESLTDLHSYDKQYNPSSGDLANTAYANYKVNTWTANQIGQWMNQDMIHKLQQQKQMYTQNMIWKNEFDYHKREALQEQLEDNLKETGVDFGEEMDKDSEDLYEQINWD